MTNLYLYVNEGCFKNLLNTIKELQKLGFDIHITRNIKDVEGYRDIEITSDTSYPIYLLGLKMGKLLTNTKPYV